MVYEGHFPSLLFGLFAINSNPVKTLQAPGMVRFGTQGRQARHRILVGVLG